jgi:uncharacterized integral membrane protein
VTEVSGVPGADEVDEQRRRRRRTARALATVVGIAAVTVFVVQNLQAVRVRFWFVTGHPRLIWVILACLAVGIVMGLVVARSRGKTRRRRRQARHPDV